MGLLLPLPVPPLQGRGRGQERPAQARRPGRHAALEAAPDVVLRRPRPRRPRLLRPVRPDGPVLRNLRQELLPLRPLRLRLPRIHPRQGRRRQGHPGALPRVRRQAHLLRTLRHLPALRRTQGGPRRPRRRPDLPQRPRLGHCCCLGVSRARAAGATIYTRIEIIPRSSPTKHQPYDSSSNASSPLRSACISAVVSSLDRRQAQLSSSTGTVSSAAPTCAHSPKRTFPRNDLYCLVEEPRCAGQSSERRSKRSSPPMI
mmetsp:Transcript_3319/g.10196  ORF Transcript_3319/g.10196 Transcript_3319/m.10196 type:complete len:258 (+) Transcript_3319:528-1301(+)